MGKYLTGRVTASPVSTAVGSLQVTLHGIPSTLAVFPVRVTGPGFSRAIGKSTTLTGLAAGTYTITANGFSTGLPHKPTCRIYTPGETTQQRTVAVGQTASVSISYTSEPCGA